MILKAFTVLYYGHYYYQYYHLFNIVYGTLRTCVTVPYNTYKLFQNKNIRKSEDVNNDDDNWIILNNKNKN